MVIDVYDLPSLNNNESITKTYNFVHNFQMFFFKLMVSYLPEVVNEFSDAESLPFLKFVYDFTFKKNVPIGTTRASNFFEIYVL